MLHGSRTRRLVAVAVLLALSSGTTAVWSMQGRGTARAALRTARATRGAVVVAVGGVGRIVEARQAAPLSVPAVAQATTGGASASSTPAVAPPGSVFPRVSGRVTRYLVQPGERISAGTPIARLDDGGAATNAAAQARSDLASAQLELSQKETHDPAQGLPATPEELLAARLTLRSAKERAMLTRHPRAADIASARLEIRKARADLAALTRRPIRAAFAAARLFVRAAQQRLAQVEHPATAADVASAGAELAKAQADLDALLEPRTPLASAVRAAQAAVTAATQKLAQLAQSETPQDSASAQAELAKAQADLDALLQPGTPLASTTAAARAAVDAATQKLAQLGRPSSVADVAAARAERQRARADLASLNRPVAAPALDAGRFAVAVARRRLAQLLHPPAADVDTAQADAARAAADLATLQRRGGPASPTDIAIARVRLDAARAHLAVSLLAERRLIVRSPVAGTVTGLLAAPGVPADPSTPIATVADLRHLAVSVDLSEFDVAKVHRGDHAILAVDALGGRALPGRVVLVALTGTDSGGVVSFPVRVSLRGRAAVKPGMNVSVKIIVAEHRNVVRVPLEAVHGAHVTVIEHGGPTVQRVTLGLADNKQVEITSGLQPGDRVLLGAPGG